MQQWTDEWLEARQGVITWTKLKDIMWGTTPKAIDKAMQTAIWNMLWEEFAEVPEIYVNQAMQRGTDLEPIAKAKYEELTNQDVTEVWFIKKNEWHWLSPDWIIWEEIEPGVIKYYKAIEIKCPGGKNFVKYIIEDKLPDEYIWQVVNYFLVIDTLEELDFIIYNPDFYLKGKQMHIINIKRADLKEYIEKAEERLKLFRPKWENFILKLTK